MELRQGDGESRHEMPHGHPAQTQQSAEDAHLDLRSEWNEARGIAFAWISQPTKGSPLCAQANFDKRGAKKFS